MNTPEEYVKEHTKGYDRTIPGEIFDNIVTTISHEYDIPLDEANKIFYANCDLAVGEVHEMGVGKSHKWPGQNEAVNFSKSNPGALAEPMSSLRISATDIAPKLGDEVRVKNNDQAPWGAEYKGIIEKINADNTFDIRDIETGTLNIAQPARLLAVPLATGREDVRIQQRRVGDPKGMGESQLDIGNRNVKQDYPNANWEPSGHPGQEVKNPLSQFYKEAMAIGPNDRVWMSTQELNLPLDINYPQEISDKPEGLWYALGTSWIDFAKQHVPEKVGEYYYRLSIDPSKILHIKTPEEIDAFTKEYGDTTKGGDPEKPFYINWPKVAEKYSGVEISPAITSRRREHLWYYGWDVPSGCIWNNDAVTDVKQITYKPNKKKEGDKLLTFLLTSIANNYDASSAQEVKNYLEGKISSPSRSLKEILSKYNIVAAAGDPMLNVEKALGEVKDKTEVQINTETAWTWGSRAAACYKLSNETNDTKEKEKWIRLGDAYRHESLEHAALAEDDGKLVGEVYKALAPFRKPAGTPEK